MPGGRPRKISTEEDWAKVEEMCKLQCTGEEIAGVMDCNYETLNRLIHDRYDVSFRELKEQKGAGGKLSLRRRQIEMAQDNPTMAIWLGKQYLGQKDRSDLTSGDKPMSVKITNIFHGEGEDDDSDQTAD